MSDTAAPPAVTRDVFPLKLLAAAGFLSVAGARVIDPLLSIIARDFSTTVPAVSILIAAFTLPYGLNQLLLGPIGDRYGKLRVMLGALLGYAVFTTACGVAANLGSLTVLRVCAGASSAGLIPVCLAYIGDAVPYDQRQITLSRFATGVVMAQMMAGPLGGAFGEYVGWRGVFFLLGGAGLLTALVLALRLRHLPDRRGHRSAGLAPYRTLLARPEAAVLLAATAIEGALTGGVFPFIAPYLRVRFGLPYLWIGVVIAFFGLGTLAFTRVARTLVTRGGEAALALGGSLVMAVVIAAVMRSPSWLAFVPAQIAIGFGYFMLHTVMQSRATELLPEARSTAVSFFVFLLFLGQGLGALATGALIAAVGYRTTFLFAALGMVVLGFWLWTHIRRYPPSTLPA